MEDFCECRGRGCNTVLMFVIDIKALIKGLVHFESVKKCNNLGLLYGILIDHLKYTESNGIRRVLGSYKMPINRAKHEYIRYYLYILYPTSCNGNTPVTSLNGTFVEDKSPNRMLFATAS